MNSNPEELNYLILHSTQPLILKNILNSDLLNWNLNNWSDCLKNEDLEFRCGTNSFTKEPQWERTTKIRNGNFEDFLQFTQQQCDRNDWLYFDYKYLKDWFLNVKELRNANLQLKDLGFASLSINDFTIWIGSKGAHTPCHADTYGCNLILQLYGRKQWVIFPPKENLKPTRVPYEESSIYSKLNFFSPTPVDFEGVGNCRKIVLKPGDILLLPHKWWHYVENLETAISMNVWLPLPEDNEERLNEALVQLLVKHFTNGLPTELNNIVLNPNVEKNILDTPYDNVLEMVSSCKTIYTSNSKERAGEYAKEVASIRGRFDIAEIIEKYNFIEKIPELSVDDFKAFLQAQRNRFECTDSNTKTDSKTDDVLDVINAVTHPDVISLIRQKLLSC